MKHFCLPFILSLGDLKVQAGLRFPKIYTKNLLTTFAQFIHRKHGSIIGTNWILFDSLACI